MTKAGLCSACRKPAELKCTACGNVYYCSKEHQKKHWKLHKRVCSLVQEKSDPQQGRYLVASRDISEGQVVIKEQPLALGPKSISTALCLGCFNPVEGTDFPRCSKCHWPLCSPVCEKSPLHAGECAYLSTDDQRHGPPLNLEETPRYDVILLLRLLALRSTKPESWKIVESMVSYAEKYKAEQEPFHMTTVKYASEILKGVCDADTAHHVGGAIITNAINTRGPRGQSLRGVYPKIFLLNHSCYPNLTLRSDMFGVLYIHAAVDIKKGDPLVFSYVPAGATVWQRQTDLKTIYNFTCSCKRCSDPTELMTYFSSPKCLKCQEGYLIRSDSDGSIWKCSKCGFTKPLEEIIKEADEFVEKVESTTLSLTVEGASKWLEEVKQSYHPKHYVWLMTAQNILRELTSESGMDALKMKRDLWKEIMQLYMRLEPGSTRRRGVTLYQCASTEFEVVNAEQAEGKFSTPHEYRSALTSILYRLDSAKDILMLEPPDTFEKRWVKLVDKERENVNKIIESLE